MIGNTDHSTYKPALTYHPLANLFPMIDGPERVAFRQSIRDNGLRQKIIMHEGMILDGRNRYRELLSLQMIDQGVDWKASPYFREWGSEESDGEDPLSFVLDLNLDRRHLNESQRASVAARMATMKRGERTDLAEGSSLGEAVETISRAEAAERLNVSERSVNSAKAVQDKGAPELVDAVDQGVLPVSVAEKLLTLPVEEQTRLVTEESPAVIKNAAKKAQRAEKEIKLAAKQRALPDKRYGVIYEDPAWRFEVRNRDTGLDRSADNHYPTMTLDELRKLPVADIAAPDCVLFMWVTVPFMAEALDLLSRRGFSYKSEYIWDKTPWDGDGEGAVIDGRQGTGFWSRVNHEVLIVATRGAPPAPAPGENFPSVYREIAGQHSAKPEHYARMIERYYPNLPKIELNARAPRDGWDVWGNESEGKSLSNITTLAPNGTGTTVKSAKLPAAHSAFASDMQPAPTERLEFRCTPQGQPSVLDLVSPGSVVTTSYGTGPYIVVSVSGPHWYAPDRGPFKCGISEEEAAVAIDRVFSHYSLNMISEADFLAKPGKKALQERSYINEVVAIDGRLLKLFQANADETFITGFNTDAALLLGAAIRPLEDKNVDSAHTEENSVNAAYIAELQKVAHLKGSLNGITAEPVMRAGYAARVPVKQLSDDLGHPIGTIKTWANRFELTSIERMHENQAAPFTAEDAGFQLSGEVSDVNGAAVRAGLKVTLTEDVLAQAYEVRRVYKNGNISISGATGHQRTIKAGEFVLAHEEAAE